MSLETKIAELKIQYPTLRTGSDEDGYTDLSPAEYDAKITEWANNQLAKEASEATRLAEEQAFITDRANGLAKLEAAGLTTAEAKAVARKNR